MEKTTDSLTLSLSSLLQNQGRPRNIFILTLFCHIIQYGLMKIKDAGVEEVGLFQQQNQLETIIIDQNVSLFSL